MNRSFFIGCATAAFLLLLTWLLSSALPPTNALASFPRGSLQNVTITGDMTPVVGKSAPLHAEYATTTTPITYTWSPVPANGQGTSDVTYIWATTVKKDLSVRVHSCPVCHLEIDRDLNAAINILAVGLHSLGVRPEKPNPSRIWE